MVCKILPHIAYAVQLVLAIPSIVNYFRSHKPNDKDGWSYQVTYESEEVKFTLFDATLNDEIQHFKVIYLPLEVQ